MQTKIGGCGPLHEKQNFHVLGVFLSGQEKAALATVELLRTCVTSPLAYNLLGGYTQHHFSS